MPGSKHQKVLIVEDDERTQNLLKEVFEQANFEVVIYQTAEGDFASEVASHSPDIISMDLMIGKVGIEIKRDGFQAIELLKADTRTAHIPVIVLTNFFNDDKVRMAKQVGAVDYINLQGQTISKLPEHYLSYLKSPKQYSPVSKIFAQER